jgi:hypothetical protein
MGEHMYTLIECALCLGYILQLFSIIYVDTRLCVRVCVCVCGVVWCVYPSYD